MRTNWHMEHASEALQPHTNITHLPRGNMGRGEISLSMTEDLKPKTEGGSWMGSGKWPTAKKRARRPNDQTSEANECLRPIKRSGLCTLTARGALCDSPAVGTTKSTLQCTCKQTLQLTADQAHHSQDVHKTQDVHGCRARGDTPGPKKRLAGAVQRSSDRPSCHAPGE